MTVKVLLDSLQQTQEFEASIAKKYVTSVSLELIRMEYPHRVSHSRRRLKTFSRTLRRLLLDQPSLSHLRSNLIWASLWMHRTSA